MNDLRREMNDLRREMNEMYLDLSQRLARLEGRQAERVATLRPVEESVSTVDVHEKAPTLPSHLTRREIKEE